jgi:hypothetical protein
LITTKIVVPTGLNTKGWLYAGGNCVDEMTTQIQSVAIQFSVPILSRKRIIFLVRTEESNHQSAALV